MVEVIEIPKWLFAYITFALFLMFAWVVRDILVLMKERFRKDCKKPSHRQTPTKPR